MVGAGRRDYLRMVGAGRRRYLRMVGAGRRMRTPTELIGLAMAERAHQSETLVSHGHRDR